MKILFLCRANVGRSQVAEAFFNRLSKKNKAISAGTHVGENKRLGLHEFVVKCMAEEGIDLSKNRRKQLTERMAKESDKIIVMTEKENLPYYLTGSNKITFWEVEDGKGQSYEFHLKMRKEIKKLVEKLVEKIG